MPKHSTPDELARIRAGLAEATRLALLHHQYWVADACDLARQILTEPPDTRGLSHATEEEG